MPVLRRLKPGVVPSIFPWTREPASGKLSYRCGILIKFIWSMWLHAVPFFIDMLSTLGSEPPKSGKKKIILLFQKPSAEQKEQQHVVKRGRGTNRRIMIMRMSLRQMKSQYRQKSPSLVLQMTHISWMLQAKQILLPPPLMASLKLQNRHLHSVCQTLLPTLLLFISTQG